MTHDEKIIEAVARAIAVARGMNPDANQVVSVPVIVSGRLTDTGHDTRVTEKRDRVSAPAWQSCERDARAAITAFQAEAWQPIDTAPKDGTYVLGYGPHSSRGHYVDAIHFWRDRWTIEWMEGFGAPTHWQPLPPAPKATPDRSEQ